MTMPTCSEHCSSISVEHHAQAMLKQCPTNATNELTKIFGLLENQSHLSNARRGAARFTPLGAENPRPAGAARGPIGARHA